MCEKASCNGYEALGLIVDPDTGPMRMLQFIDGSLKSDVAAVNAVVPDILKDDGTINTRQVMKVTKANVDEIMKVEGMSAKTNTEELWGIVQDYQALLQS